MSSLNELFKQLEVQSGNEQHEEVFETASEILKTSPHDARALRLVITSLIHLDRYLKALEVFKQTQAPDGELVLEKLYVLYKLSLDKELASEFQKLSNEDLFKTKGVAHLKAQFLYRSGEYAAALDLYGQLVARTGADDPELLDLSVNERAVLADGLQHGALPQDSILSTPSSADSHDLLFNESVIELGKGNYTKSLELLSLAEERAYQAHDDEDDQFEETLPILLQKSYILAITGDKIAAQEIVSSIPHSRISDELNKLVFENNILALSTSTNAYLTLKELKWPNALNSLTGRLSIVQKSQVWKNCWKLCAQIGKNIRPQSFIRGTDYTVSALQTLSKLADSDSDAQKAKKLAKIAISSKNLGASLMAAQLNIQVRKYETALNVLDQLETEYRVSPGIGSSILELCDLTGSDKKKLSLFEQIVGFYDETKFGDADVYEFLKITALQFRALLPEQADELLLRLNAFRKDEHISLALGDTDNSSLESPDSLTTGLDFDEVLEQATNELKSKLHRPVHFKIVKTRKRPMRRAPKELDTTKTANPERWLKLSDRSDYKPKNVKGKKTTQGGAADNTTEESKTERAVVTGGHKGKKKKGRK